MADTLPDGWGVQPDLFRLPPAWEGHPAIRGFNYQPRPIPGGPAAAELVQLAGVWSPEKHFLANIVEPKLNGIRALFLGTPSPMLVSREGAPLGCAAHCMPALLALQGAFGKPMMFDGEFVVPGAGAPNPTIAAFRRNKPEQNGTLWLFDAVPLDRWQAAAHTAPYAVRRAMLLEHVAQVTMGQVGAVDGVEMRADATAAMAKNFWRLGYEGLVIKDASSFYQRGRSTSWLKLKQGE